MNKELVIRIVTDVLMTISLLLLMPYSLLSETAHEWIGIHQKAQHRVIRSEKKQKAYFYRQFFIMCGLRCSPQRETLRQF